MFDRHYGAVLTGTLAFTVTVSYGILLYAFPVMLAPMQAEQGWSQALLTGGFSAAALASGVAAIPVGRWIDRYGAGVVMTTGSTLGVVLLLAWSRVRDPAAYLIIWMGLGACMAAVCYEPAFAAVTRRFDGQRSRARALAVITLAGGLASTLFVPLASALADARGWRSAVAWLAVTLGATTILPHAMLLRSPVPDAVRACASTARTSARVSAHAALRTATFRWLGVALLLATLVNFAVTVHVVPVLLERGFTAAFAASALALLGLAKLPGRLLVAPVVARSSARSAIVWLLAFQAMALVAFSTMHGAAGAWVFIALFGAGDGASTPARAELLAELFGTRQYGRISGVLAFLLSLGRAAGPLGASVAWTVFGGYDAVLWLLVVVTGAAAVAMTRVRPPRPVAPDAPLGHPAAAPRASFCGVSRLPS